MGVLKLVEDVAKWGVSYANLKSKSITSDIGFPVDATPFSSTVSLGDNVTIKRNTNFWGEVTLEDDVSIHNGTQLIVGPITIQKASSLNGNNRVIGEVDIGRYCAIAEGVVFQARNHETTRLSLQDQLYRNNFGFNPDMVDEAIQVGHDVWFGRDVTVLPGVTIGDGAVVGAGSVVTKDVDPYTVVAGVPAQPLRKRFSQDTREQLAELEWWYWSEDRIQRNEELFTADLSSVTDVNDLVVE